MSKRIKKASKNGQLLNNSRNDTGNADETLQDPPTRYGEYTQSNDNMINPKENHIKSTIIPIDHESKSKSTKKLKEVSHNGVKVSDIIGKFIVVNPRSSTSS